jgi:hypothetical protein
VRGTFDQRTHAAASVIILDLGAGAGDAWARACARVIILDLNAIAGVDALAAGVRDQSVVGRRTGGRARAPARVGIKGLELIEAGGNVRTVAQAGRRPWRAAEAGERQTGAVDLALEALPTGVGAVAVADVFGVEIDEIGAIGAGVRLAVGRAADRTHPLRADAAGEEDSGEEDDSKAYDGHASRAA